MKVTYRIPHPKHQFAFVEVVEDYEPGSAMLNGTEYNWPTADTFRERYDQLTAAFQDTEAGPGIPDKDFRRIYDEYRQTGKVENGGDYYEQMSAEQKRSLGDLKRSFERKGDKPE